MPKERPKERPTRRARPLHLEPEGVPTVPRERVLKPCHAIHLAERFSQRSPVTFAFLGLHVDVLEKRIQAK